MKTTYSHLNTIQKGSFGEAYAKMEFTLEGFEVYDSEYDDRGVDFVVRSRSGNFFSVQVKATDPTSNPFVKEDKLIASQEYLLCAVRLTEGQLPAIYLARGSDWTQELEHLHYNPHGGASGAYYEMRFAAKYSEALQGNFFQTYVETLR